MGNEEEAFLFPLPLFTHALEEGRRTEREAHNIFVCALINAAGKYGI